MSGEGRHGVPIEGFEVPIHTSLGAPLLLGGAPRTIAIVNGTLAAAIGRLTRRLAACRWQPTSPHCSSASHVRQVPFAALW